MEYILALAFMAAIQPTLVNPAQTSKPRRVVPDKSLSCPSGRTLNVRYIEPSSTSLRLEGMSLKTDRAIVQTTRSITGDCAGLVSQAVANLYRLSSGQIIGAANGTEPLSHEFLPTVEPTMVLNRINRFKASNVRWVKLYDVSRRTVEKGSSLACYIGIGLRDRKWVVGRVGVPKSGRPLARTIASSDLPLLSLGYMPAEHGLSGLVVVLQQVGTDHLRQHTLDMASSRPLCR